MNIARRKRVATKAQSVISGLIAAVLGLAVTADLVAGAHGTRLGVVVAAAIFTGGGEVVDFGLTSVDPALTKQEGVLDRALLWWIVAILWLVVGVPVAAFLAPDYALHGVSANAVGVVLVGASSFLIGWMLRTRVAR